MRHLCRWGVPAFFLSLISAQFCGAVEVSTVSALKQAVSNANGGGDPNIVIAPGDYQLNGVYLRITGSDITVSGRSGKRGDVILDGGYKTTEIFQILGSNVTIKDLTLKRAVHHPLHVFPPDGADVTGTLIKNVHIQDPGQQAIKINQNSARTRSVDFGQVLNSEIELTDAGRKKVWEINGSCYTGGVDAHHAKGWKVAGNRIEGFWCEGGLSEHGVHFWSFSEDTLVERNTIVNCDRGIGFGLGSSGHVGGIIRNNMIYHDSGHAYSDVGIGLENAESAAVYNNTIYHVHSYPHGIEYRFAGTRDGFIVNNLTNRSITSRNGGTATLSHNVTTAREHWFSSPWEANLHLRGEINGVVDSGMAVDGLTNDFDGERRSVHGVVDIGADELQRNATIVKTHSWLMMLLNR